LLGDGFLLKPKHAASSKADINAVVVDGFCFLFTVHVSQRDVTGKALSTSLPHHLLLKMTFTSAIFRGGGFHKGSANISGLLSELLAQPVVIAFISLSKQ
jgi:hypothetical protein